MKEIAIIAVPLVFAAIAFVWPGERTRPWLLPVAGGLHAALCLWLLVNPPEPVPGAWFGFDALARAVLPMVSLLFFVCSIYAVAYLKLRAGRRNRLFVFALLIFLFFEPRNPGATSRSVVGGGGSGHADDRAVDSL